MHDPEGTHMQDDADTAPNRAENGRARIGDDIQSLAILIDTGQKRLESLDNPPADAFVLVYFIGILHFLQ